jgi:hypothetical protein
VSLDAGSNSGGTKGRSGNTPPPASGVSNFTRVPDAAKSMRDSWGSSPFLRIETETVPGVCCSSRCSRSRLREEIKIP